MNPFIKDYLEWVPQALGDPATQRRLTTPALLRDLHAHHLSLYERLLRVSGAESVIGYMETNISIKQDVEFYLFPGNFRQFIGLERRQDDDPDIVIDRYGTIPEWSRDRGIKISSGMRGFRIHPRPTEDNTYVLRYQKQPIILHYGETERKANQSVRLQGETAIPEDQGSRIDSTDYYKGEMIHIYEAAIGAGQSIEVTGYNAATRDCTLRHAFSPEPAGHVIKYEFRPVLPRGIDKVLALSVALFHAASRGDYDRRSALKQEWKELFAAAKNYFRTTTQDRPPRIMRTIEPYHDPFYG